MGKVVYENVTKKFGNFTAVDNFNLEIEDHEFLCLVGPSGCGKSTTLRMLAGLDEITEGTIRIEDRIVNEIPPKDRGIAMVFQSYALYPHYNVYDNLAFGLRAKSSKSEKSGKLKLQLLIYAFYFFIILVLYGVGQILNLISTGLGDTIFYGGLISLIATLIFFSDIREAIKEKIIALIGRKIKSVVGYLEREKDIEEKVINTAKLLEIEGQLTKKPKQLSGGQRQRVALGRAIIRNPTVFLLDEPLSNLDAKLRVQMRAELQRLSKRLGVTSIYVTHDQIEAMTLGHRIAVMNKGILQQVGNPEDVYLKPLNKFVAGFIGSPAMNFVYGKIEEKENSIYFTSEVLDYKITERYKSLKGYLNKEVILGIRPEHIFVNPSNTNENCYNVKVGVSEPIGSDTFIYIDFPKPVVEKFVYIDFPKEFTMIVKLEGISSLRVDEEVVVTFNSEQIHFFEKESEIRINPNE
ncbi:MAG: ABC transporter ATP-binding protein [Promethearchaeota archaeon]